jgi:phosphoenolpyruvate carboxylase
MGGDDELLSSHVFKIFNSVYQRTQANVVYGNYIEYHLNLQQIMVGYSSSYSD